MLCSLYVLFSLILYNDNVNIGGNMKFSSYSSLYCFRLYDKLTYIAIYRGKYLQRRIPHASRGSFNPYIITNKEAHIINGNITNSNIKNKATSARQLSLETNDNRRHFMNYCLTHPGRYSCAVDSFLELAFAMFRDSLQHIERNEFIETLYEAIYVYIYKIVMWIQIWVLFENYLVLFDTALQLICFYVCTCCLVTYLH